MIGGFRLDLQINIDGIPLFNSTQHQFWPILGRFITQIKRNLSLLAYFMVLANQMTWMSTSENSLVDMMNFI